MSLFGQPRSSAFGPSCVVTSTYPSGFSLLSGIGLIGPSMMGSEERSGTIFKASFVLTKLKEQHMHRTHFVPRPARDNSPPQTRNRKLLLLVRSSITGLFALSRLHFPCPAEIRAAHPDAMQDDRQPPGQGDDCLLYPATRRHFHCPCFQPRPFGRPCQHYLSYLIEKRPRHSIATQRDPAEAFAFAGLIKDWGQTLSPKFRSRPRISLSTASAFSCSSLRAVSRARRFWLVSVFTCTGRNRLTRIICAMPRASFRSLLLTCAWRKAFVCRVSMHTTGSPVAAKPLNSHCDNGPASRPTRSKHQARS